MPAVRTSEELLRKLVKDVKLLQRRMARRAAQISVAWDAITGKPSTFPPSAHTQDWTTITGKPSTFPPSAHTHPWLTGVTDKPYGVIEQGSGTARWVRVARIDGNAASNGASIEMQFGTGGNYGTIERYTGRIHFSQRGDNIVSCVVISDTSVPSTPVTFHTRQVSTYVFELWAALPTFNVPLAVWMVGAFPIWRDSRALLLMDSVQTSAPSGLSAAVVPRNLAPFAMAAGTVAIPSLAAGSGNANQAVTFPAGRFTQIPIVTISLSGTNRPNIAANAITTSGFTFNATNFTTAVASSATGLWTAVQMTSGAAAG